MPEDPDAFDEDPDAGLDMLKDRYVDEMNYLGLRGEDDVGNEGELGKTILMRDLSGHLISVNPPRKVNYDEDYKDDEDDLSAVDVPNLKDDMEGADEGSDDVVDDTAELAVVYADMIAKRSGDGGNGNGQKAVSAPVATKESGNGNGEKKFVVKKKTNGGNGRKNVATDARTHGYFGNNESLVDGEPDLTSRPDAFRLNQVSGNRASVRHGDELLN